MTVVAPMRIGLSGGIAWARRRNETPTALPITANAQRTDAGRRRFAITCARDFVSSLELLMGCPL
ncbi:MAG: hypothetical protein KatS3mg015_1141 [Fimbriimonadales bacterium]|nr:MAG: hypothetical protein KatS3mg015_1141 [Fimbriimonadales bacterium]